MIRQASLLSALALAATLTMPGFAQTQPSAPRVLVIPFTTLNVPDNQEWIGRAVQEDIIADLGHTNQFAPVAFQGQLLVEDNATAVSLAHKANANLVVRGTAQMVGPDLRITAQMIDANSGDSVTTASVTGPSSDLLKLEDSLSSQLRTNLAASQAQQQQPPLATQAQQTPPAAGPVTYTPSPTYAQPSYTPGYSYVPAYTPVYSDSGYGYGYGVSPYYDYGYLGGPIVIYGGGYGFRGYYGHGYGGGYYHGGGGYPHGGGYSGGPHGGGTGFGGIPFGGGGFHGGGGFSGGGGFHGGGGGGGGGHR